MSSSDYNDDRPAESWKIEYSGSKTTDLPTLCLNMIVKNESRIIKRLLESVAPWIDSYCICDTGSTDNTVEIIETFFKKRVYPGLLSKNRFEILDIIALSHCAHAINANSPIIFYS